MLCISPQFPGANSGQPLPSGSAESIYDQIAADLIANFPFLILAALRDRIDTPFGTRGYIEALDQQELLTNTASDAILADAKGRQNYIATFHADADHVIEVLNGADEYRPEECGPAREAAESAVANLIDDLRKARPKTFLADSRCTLNARGKLSVPTPERQRLAKFDSEYLFDGHGGKPPAIRILESCLAASCGLLPEWWEVEHQNDKGVTVREDVRKRSVLEIWNMLRHAVTRKVGNRQWFAARADIADRDGTLRRIIWADIEGLDLFFRRFDETGRRPYSTEQTTYMALLALIELVRRMSKIKMTPKPGVFENVPRSWIVQFCIIRDWFENYLPFYKIPRERNPKDGGKLRDQMGKRGEFIVELFKILHSRADPVTVEQRVDALLSGQKTLAKELNPQWIVAITAPGTRCDACSNR